MSIKGNHIGRIENIVVDTTTGELKYLLITPSEELDITGFKIDGQNRVILDIDVIENIGRNSVIVNLKSF